MAKRLIFLMLFLLLIGGLPFLNAVKPNSQTFTEGYDIKTPSQETLIQGKDYDFYFHVFNISNGKPVTNVTADCYFHLYNSSGVHILNKTATHISNTNIENEWEVEVDGSLLTEVGLYNYIIQCNSSSFGGYSEVQFEVTGTGETLTSGKAIVYASFLGLFMSFFILIIYFIGKLPGSDTRDEEGNLIAISNLKYLSSILIFIDWMILISIFYLSSNIAFAYLGEVLFAKSLFMIFTICFSLTPIIVIVWFIWIFAQIFQDKRMRRLIDKGIFPNNKF